MTKPLSAYNFFDPAVIENPFEFYGALHREAPVYPLPETDIVLVSDYDLVIEALAKPELFSNKFGPLLEGRAAQEPEVRAVMDHGWPAVDTLLTNDPPSHRRFSKLVNKAFSAGRVKKMEGYMEAIVDELIDTIEPAGRCEFVADFAVKLPVIVIADQLGVPRSDMTKFKQWSDSFVARLGGMASKEEELECAKDVVAFQHYMHERLEERRRAPRDDILSDLVNARVEDERPLDDAECLNILQQLLVAGNETTTNAIAGGLLLLIHNPQSQRRIADDPSLMANMVEEVLRLEAPTSGMWRVVKQDTELGGVAIKAGAMVHLRYAAANRDPDQYEDPDAFDPARKNAKSHLAFGRGIHICIGAMLARKEMQVAFGRLFARLDNFRLQEGKNDLTHFTNVMLRGLKVLYVEFDRKAA